MRVESFHNAHGKIQSTLVAKSSQPGLNYSPLPKFHLVLHYFTLSLFEIHFRLGHHGPRTNIVTDDQRELAKQNSHVISTPFKIMYIMADLSLDDR
jgi:hypothetical protein